MITVSTKVMLTVKAFIFMINYTYVNKEQNQLYDLKINGYI